MEAVWILTNLAYGDKSDLEKICDPQFDIFSHIARLLEGDDAALAEQSYWFLANIMGDTIEFRDYVLDRIDVYKSMVRFT